MILQLTIAAVIPMTVAAPGVALGIVKGGSPFKSRFWNS